MRSKVGWSTNDYVASRDNQYCRSGYGDQILGVDIQTERFQVPMPWHAIGIGNFLLTKEMSLDDAAKHIRGPKGTDVTLSIKRFGDDKLIDFILTRDNIKVKDVAYTGMLEGNIGYIRLTRFSKNSGPEMRSAIKTTPLKWSSESCQSIFKLA